MLYSGGITLNINEYFKKVYNVAFRLTGDELKSVDMAFIAIRNAFSGMKFADKVSLSSFQKTCKEICKLFLMETNDNIQVFKCLDQNNIYDELFQNALLTLNPLKRTAIVWSDILGYKISDLTETKYSKQELYSELNNARRQVKEILKDTSLNEAGA